MGFKSQTFHLVLVGPQKAGVLQRKCFNHPGSLGLVIEMQDIPLTYRKNINSKKKKKYMIHLRGKTEKISVHKVPVPDEPK